MAKPLRYKSLRICDISDDAIYLRCDMCLTARDNKDLYHIALSVAKYIAQACLYIANIIQRNKVHPENCSIKISSVVQASLYLTSFKMKGVVIVAKQDNKTVAQNKKAYHDYFVLETYEAGIELFGTEIKSIRAGKLNLKDSWCNVVNGEMLANGVHISPYEMGNRFNRDPLRPKRLLMHKKEIMKLMGEVKQQGCALIPLSVYFNERGKAKILVGLCKGKKNYDKRETAAKRDAERNIERSIKEFNR